MLKDIIATALSMTGLIGIVAKFLWDKFSKKLQKMHSNQEALERGVQALLRDRLVSRYDEYIKCGYAPIHVKENFENMYQQYHALGANGVMDSIREEFNALPTSAADPNND